MMEKDPRWEEGSTMKENALFPGRRERRRRKECVVCHSKVALREKGEWRSERRKERGYCPRGDHYR